MASIENKRRRVQSCVDHDDLIYEILQRLPIKALLRFKSVCKPWKKMIEDPYLALKQLGRSNIHEDTDLKLLMFHYSMSGIKEFTAVISKEMIEIGTPENQDHNLASDCNGLYLFYRHTDNSFPLNLFNPVTKETLQLPRASTSAHLYNDHKEVHGLGFDVRNGVLKVIRFTVDNDYVCRKPEILILGQKSWKQLELPACLHGMPCKGTVFVNGAIHCVLKRQDNHDHILVVAFDVMKEEFRSIKFPDISVSWCALVKIRGSLAMNLRVKDATPESYNVYLLKDYNKGEWCFESNHVIKSGAKYKNILVAYRITGNQTCLEDFGSDDFLGMETRQRYVKAMSCIEAKVITPMLVNAPINQLLTLLTLSQYKTSN